MATVNEQAIRVLYEGLNSKREFRRVIYYPFMDGYVLLLITDADGNQVDFIRPDRFSRRYLPEEYWDDVPKNFQPGRPDPEWDR